MSIPNFIIEVDADCTCVWDLTWNHLDHTVGETMFKEITEGASQKEDVLFVHSDHKPTAAELASYVQQWKDKFLQ